MPNCRNIFVFSCLFLNLFASCGPEPKIEETKFAPSLAIDLSTFTKDSSGLYFKDISVGPGNAAKNGALVTARYTGWLANGTQFDSNQTLGFKFQLGAGEVISGWDLGVVGMQVGGTRQLIIPASLGYGSGGSGPIPGNSILVFSITLVAVK
jgi:FKBP-type peptidyl-prolyl cis-trans isomerase